MIRRLTFLVPAGVALLAGLDAGLLLLGLPAPAYHHHALVVHDDGRRLAKRDLAPTLAAMRDGGVDGPTLARDLATGLVPSGFRLQHA